MVLYIFSKNNHNIYKSRVRSLKYEEEILHTCFIFRAVFGLAYPYNIYPSSAYVAHLLAKPYTLCSGMGNFAFRYDFMSISSWHFL